MSSPNLSKEQSRNLKVLQVVSGKGRVNLNDLAQALSLQSDQTFYGRKLRLILADLVYSKSLKASSGRNPVYSITPIGKLFIKELLKKKEAFQPVPKPAVEAFNFEDELREAVAATKQNRRSTFGPGKKVAQIPRRDSKVIPITRPEPQIAPYPVIGNLAPKPKQVEKSFVAPSTQQPDSEAFKIFEQAFQRDPNKTLDTLVKVVFEQQRKLERQEKLLKGLHKLLGDYLAG